MSKYSVIFFAFVWISLLLANRLMAQEHTCISKSDSCMIEATLAYNLQQAEKVKELCSKAAAFNPSNDAAYYMMARIAIIEENYTEAEAYLKKAVEKDSSNYYYMATLGAVHSHTGNIPEAIKLYESIVRRFPAYPESYINLMELYAPRKMLDKAIELTGAFEKTFGPNEQFETYIADMYAGMGKDSSALIYYSKALEIDPEYIPAIYGKMEAFGRYKNYRLYLVYLKSFLSSRLVKSEMKKSYLEEVLKDPVFYQQYRNEMAECLTSYANSVPSDSSAAISSAIMLSRIGEYQKAGVVLDNILKLYPQDMYIRDNITSFLYSTENWERLEGFTDTSMTLFPHRAIDLFQLKGFAQYNQNKYDDAIHTFLSQEKAVKKRKDKDLLVQIYSLAGDMYHSKGDDNTAFRYYDKALKIEPKNPTVLNNYAWYLATVKTDGGPGRKTLQRAESMAKTAVDNSSGEFHNLDTYAWVLFLNGKKEEAKKYMQQAVAYGGNEDSGILTRYSDILASMGEYDLAIMYYKKALLKAAEKADKAEAEKITEKLKLAEALLESGSKP